MVLPKGGACSRDRLAPPATLGPAPLCSCPREGSGPFLVTVLVPLNTLIDTLKRRCVKTHIKLKYSLYTKTRIYENFSFLALMEVSSLTTFSFC